MSDSMKRVFPLIVVIVLLASCKKSESDFIWERSYGKGTALFVRTSSDSGLIACGEVTGKPYLIRLDNTRKLILEYKGEYAGLFSSVWFDTSGYIAGGNSGGKMSLVRLSPKGINLWDKSLDAGLMLIIRSCSIQVMEYCLLLERRAPTLQDQEQQDCFLSDSILPVIL